VAAIGQLTGLRMKKADLDVTWRLVEDDPMLRVF